MFSTAYAILISLVVRLLPTAGLFSKKVANFLRKRDLGSQPQKGAVSYWFHCASLGEYEMALPVLKMVTKRHPIDTVLITFFSPSGYEQAIKGPFANRVMYLPLDTHQRVRQFYAKYAPSNAIFVRYDFWYQFIRLGLRNKTAFYIINGRFQKHHFLFKNLGKPYLKLIKQFSVIFTSDQASCDLLKSNHSNAIYAGDTRYDRVADLAKTAKQFPKIESFKGNRKLLVVGSSWQDEENLIHHLLQNSPENLAIIIAPHDIERSGRIKDQFTSYSPKLYSSSSFDSTTLVLILDTIGMLSSIYRHADFVLVGGGFKGALHNIIEPAVWGTHISFGPNISKFYEAKAAIQAGFATAIYDRRDWITTIQNLLQDPDKLKRIKRLSADYVSKQRTATKIITQRILT